MRTRATPAVALAVLVLLSGVGPVVGVGPETAGRVDDGALLVGEDLAQYKVSLDNVTIKTWLIRNSTLRNTTVERVVVTNATTANGTRTNVTLTNVTVGRFVIDRGRLTNVTARKLVVRNKSILSVPGGDIIDPNVENRTIDRHWTKNATAAGVVIDQLTIDAAVLCGNATLGQEASGNVTFDPRVGAEKPDLTVMNGTVGEALVLQGKASNWSVESIQAPKPSNASLPQACNRE